MEIPAYDSWVLYDAERRFRIVLPFAGLAQRREIRHPS